MSSSTPIAVSLALEHILTKVETNSSKNSAPTSTKKHLLEKTPIPARPVKAQKTGKKNKKTSIVVQTSPSCPSHPGRCLTSYEHHEYLGAPYRGMFRSKVSKNVLGFCVSLLELWTDMAWSRGTFYRLCKKYGFSPVYTLRCNVATLADVEDLCHFFRFFGTLIEGNTLQESILPTEVVDSVACVDFRKCFPYEVHPLILSWSSSVLKGELLQFYNFNAQWKSLIPITPLMILQLNSRGSGYVTHGKASGPRVDMFLPGARDYIPHWRALWDARCNGKFVPRKSRHQLYPF